MSIKKINTDNFELRPKKQAITQSCRLFGRYEYQVLVIAYS